MKDGRNKLIALIAVLVLVVLVGRGSTVPVPHAQSMLGGSASTIAATAHSHIRVAELTHTDALLLRTAAPLVDETAAVAQQRACLLRGQSVDSITRRPIAGASKTLLETGETTVTDADGRWELTTPGPGVYHVATAHPDFLPSTRRYHLDASCVVIESADVPNADLTGVAVAPPTAPAAQAGGHRFEGALTIGGLPAPAGTIVNALVDGQLCGTQRTTQTGRYRIVVGTGTTAGCSRDGAPVRFTVTPAFGSGWQAEDDVPFTTGGATARDLAIDLRRLEPRPENVPWTGAFWADFRELAIGICETVSANAAEAVASAISQWQEAAEQAGLRARLVVNSTRACADEQSGIAVVEDVIRTPGAIAGAVALGADLRPCGRDGTCWTHKALIVINAPALRRLSALEQANVIAHEIGHALGLGHAVECNGGTIMWATTRCRFPLNHIGVDDIASLNNKIAAVAGQVAGQPSAMPAPEQLATDTGGTQLGPRLASLVRALSWLNLHD